MNDQMKRQIGGVARKDVATLREDSTVRQTLDDIRAHGVAERIVYFYVVDSEGLLLGVVPTRRLLTAPLDQRLSDVMIRRVVTIPEDATVLEAHELLARHKFLALPVVDRKRRVVGVVDVGMFTDQAFEIAEREQMEGIFESIGFRVSQVRDASPFRAFRFRFPWLIATIASGIICALLASIFELTLAKSLVLAFFLTLVLGLGESVSMQSMTVTIQALRSARPTLRWYAGSFVHEVGTALLLGTASGAVVGLFVFVWRGEGIASAVIAGSIALSIGAASLFGLSVPAGLHALRLDPKVAAGPVTLAIADICTILLFFGIASFVL